MMKQKTRVLVQWENSLVPYLGKQVWAYWHKQYSMNDTLARKAESIEIFSVIGTFDKDDMLNDIRIMRKWSLGNHELAELRKEVK